MTWVPVRGTQRQRRSSHTLMSHEDVAFMSEEGEEQKSVSCLIENRFPPTIAILGRVCTRAMGLKRAVDYCYNFVRRNPETGLVQH